MTASPPIWRLMNMGHQGNNQSETANVLSIGVGNDIMKGISHLMDGGLVDVATWKISSVFHAFSQLQLEHFSFQGIFPLSLLGTLAPPLPHIGIIQRQGRNSSKWIRT